MSANNNAWQCYLSRWPIPVQKHTKNTNKYASCPDWRKSPHADRRHCQRWPVCHTRLTTVQCISDFSLFGLGVNPWAKVHQKGRWPGRLPRSTTLQNFIALRQPMPEISVTKIMRTKKQTVNNISPACLSACGDNKLFDLHRLLHNKPYILWPGHPGSVLDILQATLVEACWWQLDAGQPAILKNCCNRHRLCHFSMHCANVSADDVVIFSASWYV